MIMEILLGFFFIFRALIGCFKLKRGIIKSIIEKSNYALAVRVITLMLLTI
jgi:hypothetical protein